MSKFCLLLFIRLFIFVFNFLNIASSECEFLTVSDAKSTIMATTNHKLDFACVDQNKVQFTMQLQNIENALI